MTNLKQIKSIEDGMMPVYPDDFVKHNNCSLSSYTYEDYIKDFELDYLGFDGIPDEPAADLGSGEIRYISPSDDRKEISKIYEKSWKHAYKNIIPQDVLNSIPEGQWANKIDTPGWHTLVCLESGKCVGTCSFCKSRFEQYPDSGEVISIYLLPEYMGRGYGIRLLDAVMNELKKQGFADTFLWVLTENSRARRFYEKYGFTCTGDYLDISIGGKDLREVRYVYRFV